MILVQAKGKMLSIVLKIDFLKLVNNSVYGKTMGNLRKSVKIGFNNNAKDYKKYVNRVLFYRKYLVKLLLLFFKLN